MGRARKTLTPLQKLTVIAYAEIHGNRAAGRQYIVDEKSVRQWRKQKDRLEDMITINVDDDDDDNESKEWLGILQKHALFVFCNLCLIRHQRAGPSGCPHTLLTQQAVRGWVGLVADDPTMQRIALYGELSTGHRNRGAPKRRFKDSLKGSLSACHIDRDRWSALAADRGGMALNHPSGGGDLRGFTQSPRQGEASKEEDTGSPGPRPDPDPRFLELGNVWQQQRTETTVSLRCQLYRKLDCPATASIKLSEGLLKVIKPHNHAEQQHEWPLIELKEDLKEAAAKSSKTNREIFDEVCREREISVVSQISFPQVVRSMAYRKADKQPHIPTVPESKTISPKIGFRRTKYSSDFKLQVVMLALQTNNSKAGRKFNVNEKLVRDWRKKEAELRSMVPVEFIQQNRGRN
ncbi:hypothetical protein Ahia01_000242600 [Argonauta hians]